METVYTKSKMKIAMAGYGTCHVNGKVAMPWFRQLVAGQSILKPRFDVRCLQVLPGIPQFSLASIIPPNLHTHLHLSPEIMHNIWGIHPLVKIIKNLCKLSIISVTNYAYL